MCKPACFHSIVYACHLTATFVKACVSADMLRTAFHCQRHQHVCKPNASSSKSLHMRGSGAEKHPYSVGNHFPSSARRLHVLHHTMQLSPQHKSFCILCVSLFACMGADCEDLHKLEGGVTPGRPSRAGGQSQLWHACRCVGYWHSDL